MVENKQKAFLIRILIGLSIYFTLMFSYPVIESGVSSFMSKFNSQVADKFNRNEGFNNKFIIFEVQDGELVSYIKNKSFKMGLAGDTAFVKNNLRTHIYMPFVFVLAISVLFNSRKRWLFILSSLLITFIFIEFKLWLYIYDQSNHFLIITDKGEYVPQLKEGIFSWIANTMNKVINIKGAIYFRYIFLLVSCTLLYIVMNKNHKLNFQKFIA